MDLEKLDKKIERLQLIVESAVNPELKRKYQRELEECGKRKIKLCDEMIVQVMNQYNSGVITEDAVDEYMREINGYKFDILEETTTWFEEVAVSAGIHMASEEFKKLAGSVILATLTSSIGIMIAGPAKLFIAQRLKRYPLIYPDCVEFGQLEATSYDLEEVEKLGIHFKYAIKWLEKGCSRIHVDVYYYNDKPVIALAYTKDMKGSLSDDFLVEPTIKGSFSKHADYYTACMCLKHQFTHPATKRVLLDLRKQGGTKVKKMKKDMAKAVEEAYADGSYQEKMNLITECVKCGKLPEPIANTYLTELRAAEFSNIFDSFSTKI